MANIIKTTNPPSKKKRQLKKKRLFIVVAAILALLAAGAVAWYFLAYNKSTDDDTDEGFTQTKEEKQLDQIRNSIAVDGDLAESEKALEDAVEAASSNEQKAEFYTERALALFYKEGADEAVKRQALDNALEAYKLHRTGGSARLVETIAKDLGEDDIASEYGAIVQKEIESKPDEKMRAPVQGGEG